MQLASLLVAINTRKGKTPPKMKDFKITFATPEQKTRQEKKRDQQSMSAWGAIMGQFLPKKG